MGKTITTEDVVEQPETSVEDAESPFAVLFGNGNALFFDESGEQIPEMQEHGLRGLHTFVKKFPDGAVFWGIWEVGIHEIDAENVLSHVKEPCQPDGGVSGNVAKVNGFPVQKDGKRLTVRNINSGVLHVAKLEPQEPRSFAGMISGGGSERWTICGNSAEDDFCGRDVIYLNIRDGELPNSIEYQNGEFAEVCNQCQKCVESNFPTG